MPRVKPLTLADIEAMPQECLTPAQVAPFFGTNPQAIREQARRAPELLGFPVVCLGTRVKIPKVGFIDYIKNGGGRRYE